MTMQGWELQDIHLRRGQTPVFAGLHLQLHEARIGLIGFNGAGKTSLLRMLAGRSAQAALALAEDQPVRLALNQTMCPPDAPIAPGDEVAFFPPVTGG